MKKVFLISLLCLVSLAKAQDFDGSRPSGSSSDGVNITPFYNTNIQLTAHTHSASHGLLFNAYKPATTVTGGLGTLGNTKFAHDALQYGGGAGAIMFQANGGTMDFLISGASSGQDTDVNWGKPLMRLTRAGSIGLGTYEPMTDFHVDGGNVDDIIWPVWVNNTRNTSAVTNYGVGIMLKHSINTELYKWGGIASVQETGYANSSGLALYADEQERVRIRHDGNVGIGIINPAYKLDVAGDIRSTEIKVEAQWWDEVFEEEYDLLPLDELEVYIKTNKHLPEIPTEADVQANGVELGNATSLLLKKLEELTLYTLQQENRIKELETTQNLKPNAESLEKKIEELTLYTIEQENRINELEEAQHQTPNTESLTPNSESLEKKIEELMLHMIQLEKKNKEQDELIQKFLAN